jgi:hypothetical protein
VQLHPDVGAMGPNVVSEVSGPGVMIEQDEPLVHVYSRGPHGDFNLRPQEVRGLDGVVELPAISISLATSEIYDGIELDAASATLPNW